MTVDLEGIVVAPITPMTADLAIDYESIPVLVDRLVDAGVDGITACAVTAETETLTFDEHRSVLAATVEAVKGRIPVYCGIGRASILETRSLIPFVEQLGGDGLFVITPYCSAYTLTEVVDYYNDVASRTTLPIMIYNCPSYAKVNIPPAVAADLARTHNIRADKEGLQEQLHQSVLECAGLMKVFTARDSYLLPSVSVGAAGVVSFAANVVPELVVDLWRTARAGRTEDARRLHERLVPLVDVLVSRSYPLMIKAALSMLGLPGGPARRIEGGATPVEADRLRRVIHDATGVVAQ